MTENKTDGLATVAAAQPAESAGGGEGAGLPEDNVNQGHFETSHLLTGLKGRAVSSGFVTILAQGAQFVLNLASIMVLARLLTPQDFGLVAMVATVMGFLRIFNEAGLSVATVQRETITHAQVSNLFWANTVIGGTITVLLAIAAPAVAWFYREPRLLGITLVLCITFLLSGSTVQHMALLKRQMRFHLIAAVQVGGAVAGLLVGIGMALNDYGYWSLVGMNLATVIATFVFTLAVSRWLPQWPRRDSGTRSLLGFGANLTASSFLWSLARGADSLMIGRIYGSVSLGLYSRAQALLLRPVDQFIAPLEAVFVPTLSRLQSQPERYRRTVFNVFGIVAVGSFFFSAMLLALARPLTLVVLGSKWEDAAPIFAGLTLVALYSPVASVSGWLMTSQGRGRDFLHMSTIASASAVASFMVGLPFGPVGVAISYCTSCFLVQLPVAYYIAGRSGPVTTRELWTRLLKLSPLWVVVFGATWLTRAMISHSAPLVQLFICIPAALLAGGAFIFAYPPARAVVFVVFDALREWRISRRSDQTGGS